MSHDEIKGSPPKTGDDGSLTPSEQENNDVKKAPFAFDFDKAMDSVKDIKDKVIDAIPFGKKDGYERPKADDKSNYRNVNVAEDPSGSLNACFALYGEVSMKRETIKTQKKEADPALFDIEMEEDEFEEQAGLRNQDNHKKFSSYFTGKGPAKKYETIRGSEVKLFKADKENTKGGFMSFIKPTVKRYVGFKDGYLLVCEMVDEKENKLKIKSKTHIERLFKLFSEKENSKTITLVFFNKELNPLVPPVQKAYKFEERDIFLKYLEEEITKCGGKLKLFSNKLH